MPDEIKEESYNPLLNPEAFAMIYQTIMLAWDREADRFWMRTNINLAIHTAILMAALLNLNKVVAPFISILGIIISTIWYHMSIQGKHYLNRWIKVIESLEEYYLPEKIRSRKLFKEYKNECTPKINSLLDKLRYTIRPKREWWLKSTTSYMLYVIEAFRITWFFILIYSVYYQLMVH